MKRIAVSLVLAAVVLLGFRREASAVENLSNHGGPTMQSARVFLIFWLPTGVSFDTGVGDGVGNFETLPARFVNDLSATPYLNIVTQYPGACEPNQCVLANRPGVITLGGSFVDTGAYPHAGTQADPLQDSDIRNEITHAISVNGWTAGIDAEFFVFTGAGIEECSGSQCTFNTFCAYHDSFDSSGTKIIYGYLSDTSFNSGGCGEGISTGVNGQLSSDREVVVMSHEFFESITDPEPSSATAWLSSDGSEIGDNCNQLGTPVSLGSDSYDVQMQWSNDAIGCESSFGASVQFDITTGDDDLRGDSMATASLDRADMSSIQGVTLKAQSDSSFGNNTGHIVVAGYQGGPTDLADLAVTLTSHDSFIETDDNWNINGLAVHLLTSTGSEICEQNLSGDPLTRLTGSVPTATFAIPNCSPALPTATFNQISFNIVTGGDDLRGDSDATATVNISGQAPQTLTLKAQGASSWDNNTTHTVTGSLASAQPLSAFVNVTVTLTSHNGFVETNDNWNIQTINLTLISSTSGQACFFSGSGNPFVRLTGDAPNVTLNPLSGC